MGYVYFIRQEQEKNVFKIGMTHRTIYDRLQQLQISHPSRLEIYGYIKTSNPRLLEKSLHKKFNAHRVHGEWFNLSEQMAKDTIEQHHGTMANNYDWVELENDRKILFFYNVKDERLLVDFSSFCRRTRFSTLYRASILASNRLAMFESGGIAFDYDLLIEDFPEALEELTTCKTQLIEAAKAFNDK